MASSRKRSKSSIAGKGNYIDLCDDNMQYYNFGWTGSYNQRALCARLLQFQNKKQSVKFITRDENTHEGVGFTWQSPDYCYSLDGFYDFIKNHLGAFDSSDIACEYWNKISNVIGLLNYKYEKIDKVDRWTTRDMKREDFEREHANLTEGQQNFISALDVAMKQGMTNGPGKFWLQVLLQNLIEMDDELLLFDFQWLIPSRHCSTNTMVETIEGDIGNPITRSLYNAPYFGNALVASTLSESTLSATSSESISSYSVVPDFCVILKEFPGRFPLVVELKPAGFESQGHEQNIAQMLSKLFFQDVVFGMVISPRSYQLLVIIKKQGLLHFSSTTVKYIAEYEDGELKLNMNVLNDMFTFVLRVLKWAKLSRCMV